MESERQYCISKSASSGNDHQWLCHVVNIWPTYELNALLLCATESLTSLLELRSWYDLWPHDVYIRKLSSKSCWYQNELKTIMTLSSTLYFPMFDSLMGYVHKIVKLIVKGCWKTSFIQNHPWYVMWLWPQWHSYTRPWRCEHILEKGDGGVVTTYSSTSAHRDGLS